MQEEQEEELQQDQNKVEKNQKPHSMFSTRNGLYLRTVMGGLIVYYAYSAISNIESTATSSRMPLYIISGVLALAGVIVILFSVKRLIKKEYEKDS